MTPQPVSRFFRNNHRILLLALALGCYVYGHPIVHFSLSIDEEGALLRGTVLPYLAQGRWGISLIRTLLVPDAVLPFLAPVNSVILLSIAAVLAASLLRLESGARWLFVALFMAFPQFAYIMEFSFLSESVAVGILIGLGSLRLFQHFLTTRSLLAFAGSVGTGALALGIYQSLLLVPVTLFLLGSLKHSLEGSLSWQRYGAACLWFALYGVLALGAYAFVTAAVNGIFRIPMAEYITEFSAWRSQDVLRCLHDIFIQYWVLYTGNAYFGEKIFLTIWIPVIGLYRAAGGGNPGSPRSLRGLILAGALVLPFFIVVAMGKALPARVFVAQPLLFAGLWALFAEKRGVMVRRAAALLTLITVVLGATNVTRLFQSDLRVAEADALTANRMVQRIYDVCPDPAARNIPVHLAGNLAAPFPKLRRSQTFGSSFFNMGTETPGRGLALIKALGIADFRTTPSLTPLQEKELSAMPVWPDPRAVRMVEDVVLVKLSNPG